MIGTLKEAKALAAAIDAHGMWGRNQVNDELLPEGWKFLGRGMYRSAYLSPSGIVYKFEDRGESNPSEARIYKKEKKDQDSLPFRFAACTLWKSVGHSILAMEYVKDDESQCWESFEAMRAYMGSRYNYFDTIDCKRKQNWHGVKGTAIITDYAYGYE